MRSRDLQALCLFDSGKIKLQQRAMGRSGVSMQGLQLPLLMVLIAGHTRWCQEPPVTYESHVVQEGQVKELHCNGSSNNTIIMRSIPPELAEKFQNDQPLEANQSGVYICKTDSSITVHYVHMKGGSDDNDCGLLLPLDDIIDGKLNATENQQLVVPCRAFGQGVSLSLEATRDCNKTNPNVEYKADQGFVVSKVAADFSGQWQCVAKRESCSQKIDLDVNVTPSPRKSNTGDTSALGVEGKTPVLVAVLSFVLLLMLVVGAPCIVLRLRNKNKLPQLSKNDIRVFLDGAPDTYNPELGLDQQADLLPYNARYEFPRENLKLGKQLGSGEFGRVVKALARGPLYGAGPCLLGGQDAEKRAEKITTVAVKMLRPQAEVAHLKALMTELKILIHVGKHLNVVCLMGACTENLCNNGLMVIVEYCQFGNLHSFMLRIRDRFVDQLDRVRDALDFTIGTGEAAHFQNLSSPETGEAVMTEEEAAIALYDAGPNIKVLTEIEKGTRSSVMEMLAFTQQGDFRTCELPLISSKDLVCWAYQVARGMEYLSSKQVVHADLAARNLLLSMNNVVKICDFGLSRNVYRHSNYRKKSTGPLPVRWMALESLQDRVFSTRSDVWSFGVVLWELFSLARTPYPGIHQDEIFVTRIREGYRMEKPQYSTSEMYELMKICWSAIPADRPDFTQLATQLGQMLEEKSKKLYLEMMDSWTEDSAELEDDPLPLPS